MWILDLTIIFISYNNYLICTVDICWESTVPVHFLQEFILYHKFLVAFKSKYVLSIYSISGPVLLFSGEPIECVCAYIYITYTTLKNYKYYEEFTHIIWGLVGPKCSRWTSKLETQRVKAAGPAEDWEIWNLRKPMFHIPCSMKGIYYRTRKDKNVEI